MLGLQRAENKCLKRRLCEYVLQGREGIMGEERKAGTKRKGWWGER